MFKKFFEGLVFGCGFSISFIVLWIVAALTITPMLATYFTKHLDYPIDEKKSEASVASPPMPREFREEGKPFHELSVEEQIEKSSVIALARYERSDDGKMKAIIREFLKKSPEVTAYYKIGDEYPNSSYYPDVSKSYGDGVVIFFVGSPATMKMSMSYSGDRITGLADLPIELFRKKCAAPHA
jgi:hypothetical protein